MLISPDPQRYPVEYIIRGEENWESRCGMCVEDEYVGMWACWVMYGNQIARVKTDLEP